MHDDIKLRLTKEELAAAVEVAEEKTKQVQIPKDILSKLVCDYGTLFNTIDVVTTPSDDWDIFCELLDKRGSYVDDVLVIKVERKLLEFVVDDYVALFEFIRENHITIIEKRDK